MNTTDARLGANPCNPYAGTKVAARLVPFYAHIANKGQREPGELDGNGLVMLEARLKALGNRCTRANGDHTETEHRKFCSEARTVHLEGDHIFDDQWNTEEGHRLFDFVEYRWPNPLIISGYYLELPAEAFAMRRTLKCGWSGDYFPADSGVQFNVSEAVLGGAHLEKSNLHLLRTLPINGDHRRPELTAEELELIMPRYLAAQWKTDVGARAKQLEALEADYTETLEKALKKRDGLRWMLKAGIPLENAIYYRHTDTFCIGWRRTLGAKEAALYTERMEGFPFKWELKKGPALS